MLIVIENEYPQINNMIKNFFCFYIIFLSFQLSELAFADTNGKIVISGAKKKDDAMVITATLSGSSCGDTERNIVEVLVHGAGAGYPFAADFSNAEIVAYKNGQQISGHRRYVTNPPMINDIMLHANPSFTYDPKKDTVTVRVTGAKRGNVGGMALGVYLMEHEPNDTPAYDGCASLYSFYNTITPLSDSGLMEGYIPGQQPHKEDVKGLQKNAVFEYIPVVLPHKIKSPFFSSLAPVVLKDVQKFLP